MVDFGDIKDSSVLYGVIHFNREDANRTSKKFSVSLDNLEVYYLDYPQIYINERKLQRLGDKELSDILSEYYINTYIEEIPSQHWDNERVDILTKEEYELWK